MDSTATMVRAALLLLVLLSSQGLNGIPVGQNYEVVFPRKLQAHHKRDTQSEYPDLVQYELEVNKTPMVLHLEKTEGLISDNYTETHYLNDGSPVTTSPHMKDHCFYQGYVKNDSGSQVILNTCNGLSGVIMTQEKTFVIQRVKRSENEAHAVYQYQADETPKSCDVEGTKGKIDFSSISKEKQDFLKARKYIELYMVVDDSMYKRFNQRENEIRQRIYSIVNYVNQVYKPLNIFVALTGFEIWNTGNQFDVVAREEDTLGRFSEWREKQLLPWKPNDNAHFLTNIDFDGGRLGLGWMGTICSNTHSAGVVQDQSAEYIPAAATLAHVLGHNLGMTHDKECCCDVSSCVMSPVLSDIPAKTFSSCSQQEYQKFLLDHMPRCMDNKPNMDEVLSPPVCGNRFPERGEECDCGSVEVLKTIKVVATTFPVFQLQQECDDKCCDAATCKLKEGAQCAGGDCCVDCKLRSAGSVCRPAKDDCDLSEMCDGKSATCASDRFRLNGSPCQNEEGYCYNGKCPTLRSQCETYWGTGSVAAGNICYETLQRHCPQFSFGQCGPLICSGGRPRPVTRTMGYCTAGECKAVRPEVLVENGTKCEDGKMCLDGSCTAVPDAIQSEDCATKCPGHSVCDHELQCQCEEGWAPPNCDTRADKANAVDNNSSKTNSPPVPATSSEHLLYDDQ